MKYLSPTFASILVALFCLLGTANAIQPLELETRVGREIRQALEQVQDLQGHRVSIRDHGGGVTLSGDVSSDFDRRRIEQIALTVKGVNCVHNLLQVRPNETGHELAERIQQDILQAKLEGGCDLSIKVSNGFVTLGGSVDSEEDARTVIRLAENQAGEGNVLNLLNYAPRWTDQEIREKLMQSLKKEEQIDLSQLEISVEDGTAVFSGSLNKHEDIDEILAIALMSPGIRNIESKMKIGNREYQ